MIDARGKLVMPGGVDVHCHLDLPMFGTVSSDDHYTGHKAAAFGGTTTVIDFVSQDFPSLPACVDAWHAAVGGKAAVDYGFHMNITHLYANTLAELPGLLIGGDHLDQGLYRLQQPPAPAGWGYLPRDARGRASWAC